MISNQQFLHSAALLGIEPAVIKAVAKIEGGGIGMQDGKPIILFEPHVFYKLQKQAGVIPPVSDICYPVWGTNPYPAGQKAQWERLDRAIKINRNLALRSCSWGMFQIMGYNHVTCGYGKIQDFVNDMYLGEDKQLSIFMHYIKEESLDDELIHKDWKGFARQYNGKYYFKNNYDSKLERAYLSFK